MKTLPTYYQEFIAKSKYARWLDEEQRREHWPETVQRYINNTLAPKMVDEVSCYDFMGEIDEAILNLEVMPSMRAMMTAGPAQT